MLTLADVAKSYGTRELFSGVSLFVARTDRFGLVGVERDDMRLAMIDPDDSMEMTHGARPPLPGGETAVLCAAAGNGAEVVVLGVDGALRQKVAVTRACGLVGVGAGVVACFDEGGLLSALRGLVAIDGSGVRFRQALPAAPVGLSVTHGGSAVFGVEGDAALYLLDGP